MAASCSMAYRPTSDMAPHNTCLYTFQYTCGWTFYAQAKFQYGTHDSAKIITVQDKTISDGLTGQDEKSVAAVQRVLRSLQQLLQQTLQQLLQQTLQQSSQQSLQAVAVAVAASSRCSSRCLIAWCTRTRIHMSAHTSAHMFAHIYTGHALRHPSQENANHFCYSILSIT